MWKLEFKIFGLPGDDANRGESRGDDSPRHRGPVWLVAGLVIAYLLGAGGQPGGGVAIISPTTGTSTFDAQVSVSGTITGVQANLVTLRVNETTQSASVSNGIFTAPVALVVGRNSISASSGAIESEPITIIRKARPLVRITSPAPVSTTLDSEVQVLGTVENLDGDSITLEVNGIARSLSAGGGRFSTKVPLVIGTNTISALTTGSEPVAVTVVRTEAARPAVVITSPVSGFTADGDAVEVTGTVINSEAPEITLDRNAVSERVQVAAGQFKHRMNLEVGRNAIRASLGEVVSNVVIVNRKPIRIVITSDPPVSNLFLSARAPTTRVLIRGTIENSDSQTVMVSVNNASRPMSVHDRRFEFPLLLRAGVTYRIHASLGEIVSNEIVIEVPSAQNAGPGAPGSPATPEQCARIQCDCDNVLAQVPGAPQSRRLDGLSTKEALVLRRRCLETQQRLRTECVRTRRWPGPCPAETSGPNAWPSSLTKKSHAFDKGVNKP